jgi:hypothetical protein
VPGRRERIRSVSEPRARIRLLGEVAVGRADFGARSASSRSLWVGSTRVYSIRVRRCAPEIRLLGEGEEGRIRMALVGQMRSIDSSNGLPPKPSFADLIAMIRNALSSERRC